MIFQRDSKKSISDETRGKLQHFWKHYCYLIVDEVSMIGVTLELALGTKTFLANLSRNIRIGKMETGKPPSSHSFGGINIIISGDFHQFPPVATALTEALYFPVNFAHNLTEAQLSRTIFEEFTTVVILTEQVHHHIKMLCTLVLSDPHCLLTDFATKPWNKAVLWNEAAIRKHCQETGHQLFICAAEDTLKGKPLMLQEHYAVAMWNSNNAIQNQKKCQDLPDVVEITVGMKVMVTQNIKMEQNMCLATTRS
ncbi:hypothetical protein C8R48DRAFT_750240 [Suillus tomentosus]|nr:hypothetical protein C8R48DRAFT_750240 [Suillus tomentosus]